tara:strand:+ start:81 stop:395 length:315 start_codon:yes stop_codon:yes gene_type:complete
MGNQHLKMQENTYKQLDSDINKLYNDLMSNYKYQYKPITKFNFEEMATDKDYIKYHFKRISDVLFTLHSYGLSEEEQEEFYNYVSEKLANLLKYDINEHRADSI